SIKTTPVNLGSCPAHPLPFYNTQILILESISLFTSQWRLLSHGSCLRNDRSLDWACLGSAHRRSRATESASRRRVQGSLDTRSAAQLRPRSRHVVRRSRDAARRPVPGVRSTGRAGEHGVHDSAQGSRCPEGVLE